jgi:hypothetical protein
MTGRSLVSLLGCSAFLIASGGSLRAGQSSQRPPEQSPAAPRPAVSPSQTTLGRYCNSGHNSTLNTAGLALDALHPDRPGDNPEAWEKVVRKLRGRMMPPPGRPRPDEATYDSVVSSLEASLDRAAAARPNAGRTDTFRRLNRTEYRNAIRTCWR